MADAACAARVLGDEQTRAEPAPPRYFRFRLVASALAVSPRVLATDEMRAPRRRDRRATASATNESSPDANSSGGFRPVPRLGAGETIEEPAGRQRAVPAPRPSG